MGIHKGQKMKLRQLHSSVLSIDADKSFTTLRDEKLLREINASLEKCDYNKNELKDYYNHIKSIGLSLSTINHRLKCLRYFFNFVKKDAKDIIRKDIENFLVEGWKSERYVVYCNGHKIKKFQRQWKPATVQLYKLSILYFYIWSSKIGKYDMLPEHVNWIKRKKIKKNYIENILSREEIKNIMENTIFLRDKCIVSLLYDGGLRISELAGLRLKDIEFDSYGAKIRVSGKTGERKVRLVDSIPIIKQWCNQHPFKNDKDKELFICLRTRFGKPLATSEIYKSIQRAVERAKITKHVYPHLFRHTKLTHMAQEGFNEMELREFAGWSKSSTMPETYLHIGEKELDEKIRRKNGMLLEDEEKKIEEDKKILKPKICPMCNEKNDINNKFCFKCGQILDIKIIKDIEKAKKVIVFSNEKKKEMIEELRKQLLVDLLKEIKGN